MRITDVKIKKVQSENRLRAIASVTIDDCFVIHELRIIEGKEGLFVAMPSRQTSNGVFRDIAHPIDTETRKIFEEVVIAKFNEEEC
ncbi:MAG: septation regulator SpoVG [Anaeroplasma bactoclasticum]|nr:septation regulator SpoVG [Anaeroplasma bactoclasticum]